MTSEEIRNYHHRKNLVYASPEHIVRMLQEIAAQLAELNELENRKWQWIAKQEEK
jgi:hypothetical protein